jgi:hypothetical protein
MMKIIVFPRRVERAKTIDLPFGENDGDDLDRLE